MPLDQVSIDQAFSNGSGGVVPAQAFSAVGEVLGAVALLYVAWVGYRVVKTVLEEPRNALKHVEPLVRAIVILIVILMIARP